MQRCLLSATPLRRAELQAAARSLQHRLIRHRDSSTSAPVEWKGRIRKIRIGSEKDGLPNVLESPEGRFKDMKVDERAKVWAETFINPPNLQRQWLHGMAYMLREDPKRALELLVKTDKMDLPSEWIADSIQSLAIRFNTLPAGEASQACSQLVSSLRTITRRSMLVQPVFLSSLLPHLAFGEVQELWSYIKEGTLAITWQSYCDLSRYFAENDDISMAVDAFVGALADTSHDNGDLRTALGHIIAGLVKRPDGYREAARLCKNLEAYYVHVEVAMANSLLRDAIENDQYDTAVDIYRLLYARTQPNSTTIALLLKAHRQRPERSIPLSQIVDEAVKHGALDNDTIIRHLLHSVITYHLDDPETAWPQICRFYSRVYEASSLSRLGLPISGTSTTPASAGAITYMLRAYLKIYAHGYMQDIDAVDVYKTWHSLARSGVQPYTEMASTDHTYNAFLIEFIRSRETLINATDTIKDMQTDFAFEGNTKPSIRSWNIFLLGLQMHDKPQLAEQVLHYMRTHNIEPNHVTWNQLIQDFADEQDLEGLLRVLKQADRAGLEWDEHTDRGVKRFANQDRLRAALQKNLDFSDELKAGIGARMQENEAGNTDSIKK